MTWGLLCRAVVCCAVQVGILQKMQTCRNTVRLLGCYETNDEVMVVTQLCSGGDLQKLSDVSRGLHAVGCQHSIVTSVTAASTMPVAAAVVHLRAVQAVAVLPAGCCQLFAVCGVMCAGPRSAA